MKIYKFLDFAKDDKICVGSNVAPKYIKAFKLFQKTPQWSWIDYKCKRLVKQFMHCFGE